MRTAFSSMVANTGSRSPGELLITLDASEVAVCCSGEYGPLVEQSRVLNGDDRLVGEVRHQESDLLVGKRPGFLPVDVDHAEQRFIFPGVRQIMTPVPRLYRLARRKV